MAHLEQIVVGGTLTKVEQLDHSAQQVDDAVTSSLHGFERNLLDNSYWANKDSIINQRGQEEYTAAGYTIDRWRIDTSSIKVSILSDRIKISNGSAVSVFRQILPQATNGTHTLSVLIKGQGILRLMNSANASIIRSFDTGDSFDVVTITTGQAMIYVDLRFSAGQEVEALAAKLELGPVQTLAHKEGDTWVLNDPPPNKALELLKCQRYFYRFNGDFLTHSTSKFAASPYCYGTAWLPTPMRVHPAVSNITYAQDGAVPEATNWRGSTDSILFQSYGGEAQILGFDASADL